MFKIFSLIIDHWPVLMGLGILGISAVAFMVPALASRLWKPIAGLAAILLVYGIGKRDEKKAQKRKTEMIDAQRKKAYDDIDNRDTDVDDVVERLRNSGF